MAVPNGRGGGFNDRCGFGRSLVSVVRFRRSLVGAVLGMCCGRGLYGACTLHVFAATFRE